MKITTLNCNGLRSAAAKGFFDWLRKESPDVLCLQETRLSDDISENRAFHPEGYHCYYNNAGKKGYSGVALFSKTEPDGLIVGDGWATIADEARYLEARFGKLSVVSLYLPSGSSGPERQAVKFDFLKRFMDQLRSMRRSRREYVLCGDWNIAHKNIDIKNWRSNQKNSGFLPEERAWMDELFGPAGFVDAFRVVNQGVDEYTWWSNRGRAREKNVGWRIDYQVVTPGLRGKVVSASIFRDSRFSDHAPLTVVYDVDLMRSFPH
ncbi:MAG: exodeoxyribonuclease III [Spirochaetes bacterium]|jgi:exodeoxyribonuclease-3|nr:exodeoxyribonuclease III [Spirochaetota bacterium]